jgi:hypothetical protein
MHACCKRAATKRSSGEQETCFPEKVMEIYCTKSLMVKQIEIEETQTIIVQSRVAAGKIIIVNFPA